MKILIADDEQEVRFLFKALLRNRLSDSRIDMVINGAEAVNACRTGNYDVLLMDVRMPVQDGYRACLEIQEICRQENLKMPFVIFCTGFTLPKEIEQLITDNTHYALLRKPATPEQIIDILKSVK